MEATELSALVLRAFKGFVNDEMAQAQRLAEVLAWAAEHGLGVEAVASAIRGLRARESVDEVIHRIRCDWDI